MRRPGARPARIRISTRSWRIRRRCSEPSRSGNHHRRHCLKIHLLAVREGKQAVNKFLGIAARSRRELSTTELERALGALDSIGDVVQTDVITRVS